MSVFASVPGIRPLVPDAEWMGGMAWFRDIAGGLLTVVIVLCVIALVGTVGLVVYTKAAPDSGVRPVSPGRIGVVLVVAILAGSMSGLVAWGTGLPLGFGSFTSGGTTLSLAVAPVDDSGDGASQMVLYRR